MSDAFEMAIANGESIGDTTVNPLNPGSGFELGYFQKSC